MTLRKRKASDASARYWAILDTDVLKFLSDPSSGPEMRKIIKHVASKGYSIAISRITVAESLDGISLENEERIAKALEEFPIVAVGKDVSVVAGHLGSLYNDLAKTLGTEIPASLVDKIVAATAVLYNMLIITGNGRDFPEPFFDVAAKQIITYKKKHRDVCQYIYVSRPHRAALKAHYKAPVREMAKPRKTPRIKSGK